MFQIFSRAEHDMVSHVWKAGADQVINVNKIMKVEGFTVAVSLLVFDNGDILHVWGSLKQICDLLPMLVRASSLNIRRP